jgi:hypothetical protein
LGKIDPTFTGGEYLPNYQRHEVEIARIELQSTTSDVISLRARPSTERIRYRLVDGYQTEFRLSRQTSQCPFSLRELIIFVDSVEDNGLDANWHRFGFPLVFNEFHFETDRDLDALRDFTRVSSDFYPDLERHYGQVIIDWHAFRQQLQNNRQQSSRM